ncbi:hypothetical protein [Candidatus Endoriftia persephonae]|jgi:hypothetical protein|uniref:ATPase n=2 Tax=Gammaproteobacteria TaxID=1236 RepID=A0A9J6ZUF1_9GAMM|nr:hypothetical protein [Candidatus Endoriftia persephone]EGW52945.1 putative ATPase involved in DNA repair [endosymbiont of Tevnia jerichonana (vent Tica)]USF86409.1 ATPase [Candidatus Endoriftia persephone]
MEPVFIDFHIHTSANPENLNDSYDLDTLKSKIEEIASGSSYLISLTDHNTINKTAYLEAIQKIENILLGVELHVRNYESASPYHCHILFNLDRIESVVIDKLNEKLNELYPKKVVSNNDHTIPKLEDIMNSFDEFEFILLPHGGQNHATFDISIPSGVQFDKTLERSVYYNHFDGFTARSNRSLERTHDYFSRLGIKDFVNLVTATDNYNPTIYPNCKAGSEASEFIPTWMLASPTFDGLRISLSESSRLKYGEKPDSWAECIQHVSLNNENIDIDASLTPGLNVVIGGSSSGKSLFVDSVYRMIVGSIEGSIYKNTKYSVRDMTVHNPAGQHPHYLDQNYISKICDPKNDEYNIDDISILKSVFPSDRDEKLAIANGLAELGSQLNRLVQSVKEIESLQDSLKRIPKLSHLIVTEIIQGNPIRPMLADDNVIESIEYAEAKYIRDIRDLDRIDIFLSSNPLVKHDSTLVDKLKEELLEAHKISKFEYRVRKVINEKKEEIDNAQEHENREIAIKRQQFEELLDSIRKYIRNEHVFRESLNAISKFKIIITTTEIESMGHKLFIDNEFELTKEKFLEVINQMLKPAFCLTSFDKITPESLFENRFRKKSPKVIDYDDFERRVKSKFEGMNKKKYRIITKEGKDFDSLSAGWKTSVILDLILGWGSDNAPLIIDQPEDNLATGYINHGLLKAIKECKSRKQIILVSHNATIPMLGDAQNIVMCRNDCNKISIRSNPLEGKIEGVGVVDLIAETTDGGKASIKKRVKKYNLKNFRGSNETSIQ